MLPRSFVTRALPVAAAAALLLGASACTDDDPPDSTPTTTRPSTSTTTTEAELSDEEQIEALEEEWGEVTRQIYGHDAPVEAAEDFLTGRYLTQYRDDFLAFDDAGFTAAYVDSSGVTVESVTVDGESAEASLCTVDADAKLDASGTTVDDEVVVARFSDQLVRTSDGWRIQARVLTETLGGARSC